MITRFSEARQLGISACERRPLSYTLAIVAFRKAFQLDPARKLAPGERPPPELLVLTRLARVYRKAGQLDKAQRVYEWILGHCDTVHARVGLAAVYEDTRRHKDGARALRRGAQTALPR